jgi:hypothetical protein
VGAEWQSVFVQDGDTDGAMLGHAVSINRAGTTALASGGYDGKVYTFDLAPGGGGGWTRNMDVSPSGPPPTEFGNSLAMSADGSVRAAGAWKDVMNMRRGELLTFCALLIHWPIFIN